MSVQRIFHIQPGTDGGTERFLITLAQGFAERGISQGFAIRPGRSWSNEVSRLGDIEEGQFLRRTPSSLWSLWRLRRTILDWKPDAIMAWRAPAARLIPRSVNAAKVVRLGDYPRHTRHFKGLNAVVCNNPTIARHVAALGWTGETSVISNFARHAACMPISRAELQTPDDAFVVCSAGRFTRVKGFDVLLHAIARTPRAWLWLVGDGEEAASLKHLAETLGIGSRLRFAGWRTDPTEVVAAADAFVLPSRDEPLGNALIEAWNVRVPTIATLTDGPKWYASHEHDCILVPIEDPAAIAEGLERMMNSTALRAHLVANAQKTLENRFHPQAVIDDYLIMFDRLKKTRS